MTAKWNVRLGDLTLSISEDLCQQLGMHAPYSDDETNQARYDSYVSNPIPVLAEAAALGYRDDEAARQALALICARRAQQLADTARQKIAELEAKAAADRRAAEAILLARQREAREAYTGRG